MIADGVEVDVPTLESVLQDSVHGSAWISLRALDVLGYRAGELATASASTEDTRREITDLAQQLTVARPPMVSVGNRVRRFVERSRALEANGDGELAEKLVGLANDLRLEAGDRESRAAANAAGLVSGKCVFTLSRSATVMRALLGAERAPCVVVSESQPGGEGRGVAQELAAAGLDTTLVPDSVMATVLSSDWLPVVDLVLVGADTVTLEGDVVNKSGTRLAALAARAAEIPFYAVLTTDKISRDGKLLLEDTGGRAPSAADEPHVVEPVFELTPAALISGFVTEDGVDSAPFSIG